MKYHNRPDITKAKCERGHDKVRLASGLKCRECNRARIRAKKYNITIEQALSYPEACEACGQTGQLLQLDHDHITGEFRGWLCRGCNTALGWVEDKPDRLIMLLKYLGKHWGDARELTEAEVYGWRGDA